MKIIKEYIEFTLEERMKVYENYQKWFNSLSEEEQKNTDDGGFDNFEEFNECASWTNLDYDADTFEAL